MGDATLRGACRERRRRYWSSSSAAGSSAVWWPISFTAPCRDCRSSRSALRCGPRCSTAHVVDQALDRFVEPPQQPGAEGFDFDGGVRINAFAQGLLAVRDEVDVAGADVVGGEPAGADVVGGDGDLPELQVEFAFAVAFHPLDR
ncbi:hypothetical protein [Streptomyces sp. A1136]|uniref:hypothetical protein n=1 Tax=Streptomyces sp. A1136 TaxID=2563102 RepID=UPI001448328B|nr:hypothetical protein [Streptomyces sp. A1136]